MLKELKFVMGAVGKKDLIPALTHFKIEDGHVRSYNGTIALSSPINFGINCTPKADTLVKAIANCKESVVMSMTTAGRLSIKSGSFKASIVCVDDSTPHVLPEGDRFEIDGVALLKAIKILVDFVGNDASRPWTNGILFQGKSIFATNNIILVEYWVGSEFPILCNVPLQAIREMIRVNEPPIWAQSTDLSITFHYPDGRWIRSQLFDSNWNEKAFTLLGAPSVQKPMDNRLFEAIDNIKPFCDKQNRIYFQSGLVSTHHQTDEGATYELEEFNENGIYSIEMFYLLKGVATTIDLSVYPKPCIFMGERLRGAIVGLRDADCTPMAE